MLSFENYNVTNYWSKLLSKEYLDGYLNLHRKLGLQVVKRPKVGFTINKKPSLSSLCVFTYFESSRPCDIFKNTTKYYNI